MQTLENNSVLKDTISVLESLIPLEEVMWITIFYKTSKGIMREEICKLGSSEDPS